MFYCFGVLVSVYSCVCVFLFCLVLWVDVLDSVLGCCVCWVFILWWKCLMEKWCVMGLVLILFNVSFMFWWKKSVFFIDFVISGLVSCWNWMWNCVVFFWLEVGILLVRRWFRNVSVFGCGGVLSVFICFIIWCNR